LYNNPNHLHKASKNLQAISPGSGIANYLSLQAAFKASQIICVEDGTISFPCKKSAHYSPNVS